MPVADLLRRPTYLYSETDRLLALQPGTARRWLNGYRRNGRQYEPILRVETSTDEWVTWGEFVETRMLAEFREDVPTARLRAAVASLRDQFDLEFPLAHLQPFLSAERGELLIDASVLDDRDEGTFVLRTGQRLIDHARPVMRAATLDSDDLGRKFAAELVIDSQFPAVRTHPDRFSGQPTVSGRRVDVSTVAGMVASGESAEDLAVDFGLSLDEVGQAVDYARKYGLAA